MYQSHWQLPLQSDFGHCRMSCQHRKKIKSVKNVDYFRVIHLNFKPGHNTDAWAILYGKIGPAVRATGRDFIVLDWESGPWDSSLYIRLDDGYGTLEYASSPQFADFQAALAEQEGGEEAGKKVWDEWTAHIDNSSQAVAHMHLPPTDDE